MTSGCRIPRTIITLIGGTLRIPRAGCTSLKCHDERQIEKRHPTILSEEEDKDRNLLWVRFIMLFYKQTHIKLIIKQAQFTNDTTTTLQFVIIHFTTASFTFYIQSTICNQTFSLTLITLKR